jgi:DNA-binding protein
LFKVILSNQNDRVVLYNETITWFDNKEKHEIKYIDVNSAEVKSDNIAFIFPRYYIRITLKNGNELFILTYKMNITKKGAIKINEYIQSMITNKISLDDIKIDAQKLEQKEDNINSGFKIVGQFGLYILTKFILYIFAYGIMFLFGAIVRLFI